MSAASEKCFTVKGELGLHARPAGQVVAAASRFEAHIEVARDGSEDWVDGKSILSLLSLAAGQGTVLRVRAAGPDAEDAMTAVGAIIEAVDGVDPVPAGGGAGR